MEGAYQKHGETSIRGLWEIQTEAIIDVRFEDTDVDSQKPVRMDKFFAGWEKLNKDKHGKACYCYDQRRHLSPFNLSMDKIMGKEALVVLDTLSQVMASKMDKPILNITGWVNGRIKVAVARSL